MGNAGHYINYLINYKILNVFIVNLSEIQLCNEPDSLQIEPLLEPCLLV